MIRTFQIAAVGLVAALALTASDVGAVQQPAHLPQGLELSSAAATAAPRALRTTTSQAPRVSARAWHRFRSDVGGQWLAIWDESTKVPLRVFGRGTPAPGAVANASAARAHADAMLAKHLELFAPGAKLTDFVLAANEVHDGMRVVSFFQLADGMRVLDAQLSFRFKNDRLFVIGSEAVPYVSAKRPGSQVSATVAEGSALAWIGADYGPGTLAGSVEGPFVLPVLAAGSVAGYETVVRVTVDTAAPIAKWDVYLDAKSGAPVAREQTLRFASATMHLNAPVRQPLDERMDHAAQFTAITVDGSPVITNEVGLFSFADGAPVDGTVTLDGPFVRMRNDAGVEATPTFTFAPDSTVVWDASDSEFVDAQLTTFVHAQKVKDYAKSFAPNLLWLDGRITATVNINDSCNAYYDGSGINFYRSSGMCENTGRIADVVYHEFGHGVHDKSIVLGAGQFDGALSEGVSDYLAATITNDPGMGRGFFKSQQPLRDIDPAGGEYIWPDNVTGEVHQDGLIIGGALWDLRKLLVAKHGEQEGVALADSLYFGAMRMSSDIPSMYPEMLAADDDDGDLTNGTPNVCEIIDAFGAHGLRPLDIVTTALSVEPPSQEGFDVSITIEGLYEQCGDDTVESATVVWGLQRLATQQNTIVMSAAGSAYSASIPPQSEGEVVKYRVAVALGSGQTIDYPNNAADPMYQFFVGKVVPLYCTDFETDPALGGWTHGLLDGEQSEGADDWQWGEPNGNFQNGDPPVAFSGSSIFGNDLGWGNFNGLYQSDKRNYADSPVIDASGYDNVRLQYRRWLNVEDASFDQATVWVNHQVAWRNRDSFNEGMAKTHHQDREWRFHDVDITKLRDEDGSVQVRFEIQSNVGLEMGGWSLDDFCVVAYEGALPGANCGDGMLDAGEACDDGNIMSGDGCNGFCAIEDINEEVPDEDATALQITNGCVCNLPGGQDQGRGLALFALGALALLRRRRQ